MREYRQRARHWKFGCGRLLARVLTALVAPTTSKSAEKHSSRLVDARLVHVRQYNRWLPLAPLAGVKLFASAQRGT